MSLGGVGHVELIEGFFGLTDCPLMCDVNNLSQYMVEPRHVHLGETKHVMRYLKGTLDCGFRYASENDFRLMAMLIYIGK